MSLFFSEIYSAKCVLAIRKHTLSRLMFLNFLNNGKDKLSIASNLLVTLTL